MPDANKFGLLRDIGYTIPVTCGLCKHRNFPTAGSDWGTCRIHLYNHLKHTGPKREMSIHRSGCCSKAVLDEALRSSFGAFGGMIEEKK